MTWLAPLVLLLAQGAAAPAPREIDPKVAEQVPIIAAKLDHWRGAWAAAGGKLGCKTLRSSGDEEIDALGCAAMLSCVKPAYPELKKIADGPAPEADKKRQMEAKLAALKPCLTQRRGQGIAEIALRRGRG
jgi:hypothetical protein